MGAAAAAAAAADQMRYNLKSICLRARGPRHLLLPQTQQQEQRRLPDPPESNFLGQITTDH